MCALSTQIDLDLPSAKRRSPLRRYRSALAFLIVLAGGSASLLRWGGDLLVAPESMPPHAQAAVMLNGSLAGVTARREEAIRLLDQGKVDHVLLSMPQDYIWGSYLPELARGYLEKRYGAGLAERITFCSYGGGVVHSTATEAELLRSCLEQRGWRSIIVVTSNYHTRRAGIIWRKALAKADPAFTLTVHGVFDGEFQPRGWWRQRIYAKTWLLEVTKLAWISLFGERVWK